MSFSKKINQFRRTITRSLTHKIGFSSTFDAKNRTIQPAEIKTVLISRPNGRVGNLLLITPLLQEITATFPNCTIDVLVKGSVAPIVFKNYTNIGDLISLPGKPFKQLGTYLGIWYSLRKKKYDVAINVDFESSSGRLSTQFSKATYKFFGDVSEEIKSNYPDCEHIAKYPIYSLRHSLTQLGLPENKNAIPNLDLKLSTEELELGKEILQNLVGNDRKTICVFTYATGEKCLSEVWWNDFYVQLKTQFQSYNILEILPKENVSKIDFQAPSFYSNNLREMGAVIANSVVFIGADSGIMHLASSVQTPTIGLFSVSKSNKYQPYNAQSVSFDAINQNTGDCIAVVHSILATN